MIWLSVVQRTAAMRRASATTRASIDKVTFMNT